jgi:hypothetical protein
MVYTGLQCHLRRRKRKGGGEGGLIFQKSKCPRRKTLENLALEYETTMLCLIIGEQVHIDAALSVR